MIYLDNNTNLQQVYIPRAVINKNVNAKYATEKYVDDAIANETARTEETYAKITDLDNYTQTSGFSTINGSAITEGGNIEIASTSLSAGTYIDITDDIISVTGITVPTNISELNDDIGIATTGWVESQGYLTEHQSLSGLFASVNYISSAKTIYFYDKDNTVVGSVDATDFIKDGMVDRVYISGNTLYIVFNSDAGKETIEIPLRDIFNPDNYYTKTEVDSAITSAMAAETARTESTYLKEQSLSAYSTTEQVEALISSAKTEVEAEIPSKVSDLQNDLDFASTGDVESMISGFTTSADVKTQIESYNYIDSGQAQTQIDSSISGKLDTSVFNAYSASTDTVLQNKVDSSAMTQYATTAFTENTYAKTGDIPTKTSDLTNNSGFITSGALLGYATEIYVDKAVSGKADSTAVTEEINTAMAAETARTESTYLKEHQSLSAYTPTSGFSTINGSAITDGSNIVVEGTPYSGGTNISIQNHVISVTGITIPTDISDLTDDIGIATTGWVESQGYLTEHQSLSAYTPTSGFSTINGSAITDGSNLLLATTGDVQDLSDEIDTKQDTLVSGTNIKTINNQSLLGSGNINIQGGSGSTSVIELTQAEYDALTAYTEDAIYVITDAQEINMNNYATTVEVSTLTTQVETLTDTVAHKASPSTTNDRKFPRWNNEGIVTGTTGNSVYTVSHSINGSNYSGLLRDGNSGSLPSIYAPTTQGTKNQVLLSNGSGAPVWSGYKFVFMSQSEYDALTTKDSTTIYFITSEN